MLALNRIRQLSRERVLHWQGKQVCLVRHGGWTQQQSLDTPKAAVLCKGLHCFPKFWCEQSSPIWNSNPTVCHPEHGERRGFLSPIGGFCFGSPTQTMLNGNVYRYSSSLNYSRIDVSLSHLTNCVIIIPALHSIQDVYLEDEHSFPFSCQSHRKA